MTDLAGIDIGGTKCAVSIGRQENGEVHIIDKEKFPTPSDPLAAVRMMMETLERLLAKYPQVKPWAIGISCGSPLDSRKGVILSPPNLPGWDKIDVIRPFEEKFGIPTALQNDANACALAEWLWGAGKGLQHMIFLTFGTGLGAGLILNGRLYSGACDMAGEAGHIRLEDEGPVGYGKAGSFEGYCSGGGIARYGAEEIKKWLADGKETIILKAGQDPDSITAADIAEAAAGGDPLAMAIYENTGRQLGKGIAVLIDILNPEKIVIGSIFLRQEKRLRPPMEVVIEREALSYSRKVCQIVPAQLGEQLGDYAALSVAGNLLREKGII